MVIKKTKISRITAAIVTIAVMVTMGAIGGAGQQIASATILDVDDLNGLIRQGIVDDVDSSGTDSSIIIVPDVTWIAPEVSSRIPDIGSIVPVPDTSFATDVVDDVDSSGTDTSIIDPDVNLIIPDIGSIVPDVDSIVPLPDVHI